MHVYYVFEVIWGMSTLRSSEYIQLAGEFNYLIHGASIDPGIFKRGYSEDAIKQLRERITPKIIDTLNLRFTDPIENFKLPSFDYFYRTFIHYQKFGRLPYPGTFTEQPAKIIEIFETFTQLETERDLAERKANER